MHKVNEVVADTTERTEAFARESLRQIGDIVELRAKLARAHLDVANITDLSKAREVLETQHGAVFTDANNFTMYGQTGKLQGPRGDVGCSRASRAKRKRERQARKAGRK